MKKKIAFYGGPASGKSTVCTGVFSKLKQDGFNIELVTEYVKEWTYIERFPKEYDQFFIFSNQLYREHLAYRGGFDIIATDSPIMLTSFYAQYYDTNFSKECVELAKKFEQDIETYNVFLNRKNIPFSDTGRFQNKKESIEIDKLLKDFLDDNNVNFFEFNSDDTENMYHLLKRCLNERLSE